MFILETNDVGTAMFAKGQKVESDIDLWHKRISHVNFPNLQKMQSEKIVFDLPKFNVQKGQSCEAFQLGKHHQLPLPNEKN